MNGKGVFCFILVLAFLSIELALLDSEAEAGKTFSEGNALAFEAEKLSLTRAVIENSTDAVIEESLGEALALGLEAGQAKTLVNARLAALFREMEKAYDGQAKVAFSRESLDESFLNRNSTVFVARIEGKTLEAEYCFTGGLARNEEAKAEITGKSARLFFRLPAGYTVKAVG